MQRVHLLVRPCFLLTGSPSVPPRRLLGWRAPRQAQCPSCRKPYARLRSLRHVVTVDSALLAELGRSQHGLTQPVRGKARRRKPKLPHRTRALAAFRGNILHRLSRFMRFVGILFPPIEAVCLYGAREGRRMAARSRSRSPPIFQYISFAHRAGVYGRVHRGARLSIPARWMNPAASADGI